MKSLTTKKYEGLSLILITLFLFSGCATLRNPVPKDLVGKATVSNMNEVRTIVGVPNPAFQEDLLKAVKNENNALFPVGPDGIRTYPILVISGGGDKGAYGAGLLKGWSKEGTRPVFKSVTGVSTGALSAPFAFLGKDYDDALEKYYTTTSTKDVMTPKAPLDALNGDSLASNQPLANQIAGFVDKDMLDKIAQEHRNGRRLYIGTVNLDAQSFVIWNMGAIAERGDIELFRKVILASAAIPIVFPPSHISVEVGGKTYEEMHVDGGTMTQMFALYGVTRGMAGAAKAAGIDPAKLKAKYYFIRNGYVTGTYKPVNNKLTDIANRTFETMINSQGVGDTYRIYEIMKQVGNDYNLAWIPSDLRPEAKEMFDPQAMRILFDRGYQDAVNGYKWHKAPPGLDDITEGVANDK